jgi:hypothetical protein
MYASRSLSAILTAPLILIVARIPAATSRATVRSDTARRAATAEMVSN